MPCDPATPLPLGVRHPLHLRAGPARPRASRRARVEEVHTSLEDRPQDKDMRIKRKGSPMETPRCAAKIEGFRLTCDLPRGHVKVAEDWHEGSATNSTKQVATTYAYEMQNTETVRWAPHDFEVPRPGD